MNSDTGFNMQTIAFVIGATLFIIFVVLWVLARFKTVPGNTAFVVERFGVPDKHPWKSGLHFLTPFSSIRSRVSLETFQNKYVSECRTLDDVFLTISWVVRFSVQPTDEAILNWVYKLDEPAGQIMVNAERDLRQIVSGISFSDLYTRSNNLGTKISSDISVYANTCGVVIEDIIIEQPNPPKALAQALTSKATALADKEAAAAIGDALLIKITKEKEAEKVGKKLSGEGWAEERKAIVEGYVASMEMLHEKLPNLTEESIASMMISINNTDALVTVGKNGNSVVYVPHNINNGVVPLVADLTKK